MTVLQSTRSKSAGKPAKPSLTFPLWWHPSGQWCKKHKGKNRYFGSDPNDPWAAYRRWEKDWPAIVAGETPQSKLASLTVREASHKFLEAKRAEAEQGEISFGRWNSLRGTCRRIVKLLGEGRALNALTPPDIQALRNGIVGAVSKSTARVELQRTRQFLRHAHVMKWLPEPIPAELLAPPREEAVQREKHANGNNGSKTLSAAEIRALLEAANPGFRAMILLGVNCGFGNSDLATLPEAALAIADPQNAWVDHPRPKTSVARRVPLWPRTVAAFHEALEARPAAREPAFTGLVFLTHYGRPWVYQTPDTKAWCDSIISKFRGLCRRLGILQRGRGFYSLRHSFATVAANCYPPDALAVSSVMGHRTNDKAQRMTERYIHSVDDFRLRAVVGHVHEWLFDGEPAWPAG